jgi:quercetin dioxygenase-like cupin family protein
MTLQQPYNQGRSLDEFNSSGVKFVPILREIENISTVGCMYLDPHGVIGMHPTVEDQLLLVVQGSAEVIGKEEEVIRVEQGSAVFWEAGESHETRAGSDGLIAIVIEGERLSPEKIIPLLQMQ